MIYLTAFDVNGDILGEMASELDAGDTTMHHMGIDNGVDGIAWVQFGAVGGLGGIYADNLTYKGRPATLAAVPLPTSGAMLAFAVVALAGLRRKGKAALL